MSWQDVSSFYEEWEPDEPDFKTLNDTTHTARKRHSCDGCDGLIAVGERYRKIVVMEDGRFTISKWHLDPSRCVEAEKQHREWESYQNDIMGEILGEQYEQEHAVCCWLCDGWGIDLFDCVGDECRTCGGAGKWDNGEVCPEAFEQITTEPRIPANLTNLYRPRPRKAPVTPEPQPYDESNLPF